MGMNLTDLAEYINRTVKLRAVQKELKPLEGTISHLGFRARLGVEVVSDRGRRIGFLEGEIPVSFTATVSSDAVMPVLGAPKHILGITGTVDSGSLLSVNGKVFEFVSGSATVASGHITVPMASTTSSTIAQSFYNTYLANLGTAGVTLVNATTIAIESRPGNLAFVATNLENVSVSSVAQMQNGVAAVTLELEKGEPVEAGDEFELTFGPVTRPDGRSLSAETVKVEVT